MEKEQNNLDRFKGKNPFTVPDGYMEDLTANIMSQLPEKPQVEAKKISMMDRMRPWLYMAAVFAGLGLFFKAIVGIDGEQSKTDTLLVQSNDASATISAIQEAENEEYLEYLEAQYTDYLLAEELGNYE
ncbi:MULTISPECIES: hypothetical protein [Parabacteroides]|jgi:hypothetical protein|uniref:Uncharacterized protein n=1 Tax=Parabacteroides gordonii MS-1 = DSM 23371 TaxID=1203610 RepID=A0A0F5JCI7_9BACT|nr:MULTISPECIES: hypothetical protein [Parabacteroides]KKB52446.1 hypothetical protein HMPREF1212_00598 [Parabacteroides sp. HGS0025]KKB55489.1 hypothetical protein HMPREF1536_02959 [Parabacteroides gordonii MS-1 = DSM 23371]MCA5581720.1 hypothetical protein [Parabacteroides gordonii]